MKNNLIYTALLALTISFTACEKDNDESKPSYEPKDAPVLISKTIHSSTDDYGRSESIYQNVYDEGNKLVTQYGSFRYYREGEMVQDDKDTISYVYNEEGKVAEIIRTGTNWPYTRKFDYSGNVIIMTEHYFNGESNVLGYKSEMITDDDGKLIRNQGFYYDDSIEDWVRSAHYYENDWQDGNIIKSRGFDTNSNKSATIDGFKVKQPQFKSAMDTVLSNETIYTYSDKIDPYAYSSLNIYTHTRNLLLSSESTRTDARYSWSTSVDYEFAANGFPSKETTTHTTTFNREGEEPDINTSTYTTEYEYIDLK